MKKALLFLAIVVLSGCAEDNKPAKPAALQKVINCADVQHKVNFLQHRYGYWQDVPEDIRIKADADIKASRCAVTKRASWEDAAQSFKLQMK